MSKLNTEIWNCNGLLHPLSNYDDKKIIGDVAVIIVNRDRPDLTDSQVEQINQMIPAGFNVDIYVIEMGSKNRSKYESFYYDDPDYRGKSYGHNVGLRYVLSKGKYRFYWVLMNDLVFDISQEPIKKMYNLMIKNKEIGILSPTEEGGPYPSCRPVKGKTHHIVSTTDYLSLFVRGSCINQFGYFLNPNFKYCWGAIHEFAHKINREGLKIAYCDLVQMKHLGGTTYGKVKGIPSRQEYQIKARRFAAEYFINNYGKDWDIEFTKYMPKEVRRNTFKLHKVSWEKSLRKK